MNRPAPFRRSRLRERSRRSRAVSAHARTATGDPSTESPAPWLSTGFSSLPASTWRSPGRGSCPRPVAGQPGVQHAGRVCTEARRIRALPFTSPPRHHRRSDRRGARRAPQRQRRAAAPANPDELLTWLATRRSRPWHRSGYGRLQRRQREHRAGRSHNLFTGPCARFPHARPGKAPTAPESRAIWNTALRSSANFSRTSSAA